MKQVKETKNEQVINPYKPDLPQSAVVFANIVHWVTIISSLIALFAPIFILINSDNNVLNPNLIFGAIFNGAKPEEIWALSTTGSFPGAHFYFQYFAQADSWAMFGVNIGCGVALWGLIPAIFLQLFKEKEYFYALLGIIFAVLILLSMIGIITLQS